MDRARAAVAANACLQYSVNHEFSGPDPYDGLSGTLGKLVRTKRSRQIAVQLVKRAPAGARTLLGIRPVRMSKALALFAMGSHALGDVDMARRLIGDLLEGRSGAAWGYEFDVQTRWAYYPAHSANIIATSYAVEAIASISPDDLPAEALLQWFEDKMMSNAGWVRYVPTSQVLVHNANILGARAYHLAGGDRGRTSRALAVTLRAQRPDGSWPYGEGPGLAWVDNFHTVYVLRSLWGLRNDFPEVVDPVRRGVDFWLGNLFDHRGAPLYSIGNHCKVDIHNISTALRGLVLFSAVDERAVALSSTTLDWLLRKQRADGSFRTKPFMPSYMRWNNAHAFEALAQVAASRFERE